MNFPAGEPLPEQVRLDAIENALVIISAWLTQENPRFTPFANGHLKGFAQAAVSAYPDERERNEHMIYQTAVLLKIISP